MELTYSELLEFCDSLKRRGHMYDILTACQMRSFETGLFGVSDDEIEDTLSLGNTIVEKKSVKLEENPMISYHISDSDKFLRWNLNTTTEPRKLLLFYLIFLMGQSDVGCPYNVEFVFDNSEDRKEFDDMPNHFMEVIERSHPILQIRTSSPKRQVKKNT